MVEGEPGNMICCSPALADRLISPPRDHPPEIHFQRHHDLLEV
jgi:hypothetical protein